MRLSSHGVFTNRKSLLRTWKIDCDGPPSSDTCRARRIRALTQGSSYEASHRRRIIVRGHASHFVFVRGHGHLLHAYSFDRRVASIAGCGAVSNRWVPG
ncbi:hypothetical protein B296_00030513 [Ensete ventricosum]|uniref:Uncharacterized protein n=1 Tax=Ensete ventricosum TaxID=4639 RepID=A0A427ADW5_ENSVE|nr:hypothetical protein B296_00030513 [Ensete ventricosum]